MLDLARIRAISLDLDDTLWPIAPVMQRAERVLHDWLTQHAPMTAAMFASPEALAEIRRYVGTVVVKKKPHLAHDLCALRTESIRLALYRAGDNPLLAEQAFEAFFAERNKVEFYVNALPTLRFFSSRYPIVALSNGNAQLDQIGIAHYFRHSVRAREFGIGKPDVRIFQHAASLVGVSPHEVLHVGDDGALDVVGAINAGMQAVWLNRLGRPWEFGPSKPTVEVNSLAELLTLFGCHDFEPVSVPLVRA
jgi:FMN hydrolase / 5-amino-6-(5-phospho-D-ribitylamino)uracil phosphatase